MIRSLRSLALLAALSAPALANQAPVGYLDEVTPAGVARGWALDPDAPQASLLVHVYADAPYGQGGHLVGATRADQPRPDVNLVTGYAGNHGFLYTIPAAYRGRRIYAHAIDTAGGPNPELAGGGAGGGGSAPAPAPAQPAPPPAPAVHTSGDLTLRGREVTIRTSRGYGAAVTGLTWSGRQFVNNDDHGRQIQIAWTTGQGEAYNPTEAGSNRNRGNSSSTRVLSASVRPPTLVTRSHPAFWLEPGQTTASNVQGQGGRPALNTTITSSDVLEKRITVDYKNDPHLIRWDTFVTLGRQTGFFQLENPASYMTGAFNRFHTYEPRANRLLPLRADPSDQNAQWADRAGFGEQAKPVVISTASGSHALGIWTPESGASYGRWNFTTHFDSGKIGCVIRRRNLRAATHHFVTYLAVGTVQDVTRALRLAAGLAPVPAPSLPTPPPASSPAPAPSGSGAPQGHLDGVTPAGFVHGWALDPDVPAVSIQVHVYADGPAGGGGVLLGAVTASGNRPDVNQATGYPGRHGFGFDLPPAYRSGRHPIYVYAIDTSGGVNPLLGRTTGP